MDGVSSLEELMECNSYVRGRFLSCQNRLFVILWGSFQKAISGLARLYKEKLDNRCDNQCLLQALYRIESFYQMSQNLLKYAKNFGITLGYNCRRLLLRDALFSSSSNDLCAYDVYAAVLQPFIVGGVLTHGHKRKRVQRCKRCFKRRRRLSIKRCCVISPENERKINQVMQPFLNHYDLSTSALDGHGNWTVSISGFSSPAPPALGNWRSFLSTEAAASVDTLELIMPSVNELQLPLSPNQSLILSRRKRRLGFTDDYHPYSLIDSMSKFCLHSNSKIQCLESVIDADIREDIP
ncbi:unnamed protein product [Hydatigera taeniaeformis]|uniref:Nucleic acid binding protein n=1 Tax=Hydatigena taeniaeformis TaxID=6205 RepID=A0A0R3XC02_HYDTA|nr:unnamed protein product [Hydatigera taeniaeformis]